MSQTTLKIFLMCLATLSLYAPTTHMPLKELERHRGDEKALEKLNRKQSKKEQDQLRKKQQLNKVINKELESN